MSSVSRTADPTIRRAAVASGCPSLLGAGRAGREVAPQTLVDLHLDAVVAAAASGDFQRSVWHAPVTDLPTIEYRQDVADDVRTPAIRRAAEAFEQAMAAAGDAIRTARGAHYRLPAELRLLEAIRRFTEAVAGFADALGAARPASDGLRDVAGFLSTFRRSPAFAGLAADATALLDEVRTPTLELGMQASTVWVDDDHGRVPWAGQIADFFARFASGTASTAVPARPRRSLNHVEAQAVGLVAQLRPELFARVHRFAVANADFLPARLDRLAEELRFYLGFWKLADRLAAAGVQWCRPRVSAAATGRVSIEGMTDPALGLGPRSDAQPLVPNDFSLGPDERIAFVTGPNQGGKTTFARTVGQVAHLASLGLHVPARSAVLPLLNPVLTHFPQPDDPEHERGGLADEMFRLRAVLEQSDAGTLLVLNELFSATSAEDALELSSLVVPRFEELGVRVVWVTFLEELVASTPGAVSLVGQVATDDPTRPTFRFRRRPPAGRSHAAALAARHGLGADDLARRLP